MRYNELIKYLETTDLVEGGVWHIMKNICALIENFICFLATVATVFGIVFAMPIAAMILRG